MKRLNLAGCSCRCFLLVENMVNKELEVILCVNFDIREGN